MKFVAAASVACFVLVLPLASPGQMGHMAHHEATTPASSQAAMTDGVVKKVDKAAGSVTIAHEALTNLDMPKMTMTFLMKDRAWLDGLKEGTRIRFAAENVNGTLTVIAWEQVN